VFVFGKLFSERKCGVIIYHVTTDSLSLQIGIYKNLHFLGPFLLLKLFFGVSCQKKKKIFFGV
jgi:hypothetical protein